MCYRADNSTPATRATRRLHAAGFTLLEVVTALGILALISSSVLLVINRCMAAAANATLRMEAFRLVQENLEKVLVGDSVAETVEFGASDKYPDVAWQTVVEAFPEPVTGKMWVRAVCSAQYLDSAGEKQTVELVHWVTELTDQQAGRLMAQDDIDALSAEQLLDTVEEAAQYAGVEGRVIEEWLEKGLVTDDEGAFIKYNLDVFVQSKGDPTAEDKRKQVRSIQELALALRTEMEKQNESAGAADGSSGRSTTGEPAKMSIDDIMKMLQERQKQK
jgi:prepilin-type N-terminal cleavage/methylation domain-containing protein